MILNEIVFEPVCVVAETEEEFWEDDCSWVVCVGSIWVTGSATVSSLRCVSFGVVVSCSADFLGLNLLRRDVNWSFKWLFRMLLLLFVVLLLFWGVDSFAEPLSVLSTWEWSGDAANVDFRSVFRGETFSSSLKRGYYYCAKSISIDDLNNTMTTILKSAYVIGMHSYLSSFRFFGLRLRRPFFQ